MTKFCHQASSGRVHVHHLRVTAAQVKATEPAATSDGSLSLMSIRINNNIKKEDRMFLPFLTLWLSWFPQHPLFLWEKGNINNWMMLHDNKQRKICVYVEIIMMCSDQSWTHLSNTGLTESRYLNCGRFAKNLRRERKHSDTMSFTTKSYFTRLSQTILKSVFYPGYFCFLLFSPDHIWY